MTSYGSFSRIHWTESVFSDLRLLSRLVVLDVARLLVRESMSLQGVASRLLLYDLLRAISLTLPRVLQRLLPACHWQCSGRVRATGCARCNLQSAILPLSVYCSAGRAPVFVMLPYRDAIHHLGGWYERRRPVLELPLCVVGGDFREGHPARVAHRTLPRHRAAVPAPPQRVVHRERRPRGDRGAAED